MHSCICFTRITNKQNKFFRNQIMSGFSVSTADRRPHPSVFREAVFAMSMSYHNHIFPFRVDIRGYVTLWLNDKHSLKWVKMRPHPLTGTNMLSIQTIILHAQVNTYWLFIQNRLPDLPFGLCKLICSVLHVLNSVTVAHSPPLIRWEGWLIQTFSHNLQYQYETNSRNFIRLLSKWFIERVHSAVQAFKCDFCTHAIHHDNTS